MAPLDPTDFMAKGEVCDLCKKVDWTRIRYGKFVCDACEPPLDGFPNAVYEVMTLYPAPGQRVKMKKVEANEIKRHRILPYQGKNGERYPGRMNDAGKIEERPLKS